MYRIASERFLPSQAALRVDQNHPLARGLVAAYLFNVHSARSAGARAEGFDSAHGMHQGAESAATAANVGRFPWSPAAGFDTGSFGRINVPHQSRLDILGDVTILCWVRPKDANTRIFMAKGQDNGPGNVTYGFGSNAGVWAFIHSAVFVATSAQAVVANKWSHLAMVRTVADTTIKYYVDGVRKESLAYATGPTSNTQSLGVGGRGNDAGGFESNAQWAQVLIFNRALNPGEIAQLYRGLPFFSPIDEDVIIKAVPTGPLFVLPNPATMKFTKTDPLVVQSSLVLAPPAAAIKLLSLAPGVVGIEPFKKLASSLDPGWTKKASVPPIIPLDVVAISGPAMMKVRTVNPVVNMGTVAKWADNSGNVGSWFRSVDGLNRVEMTGAGQPAGTVWIWMDERNGRHLLSQGTTFERSQDGGDTWIVGTTAGWTRSATPSGLRFASGTIIWAAIELGGALAQYRRSTDGMASWEAGFKDVSGSRVGSKIDVGSGVICDDQSALWHDNTSPVRVYRSTDDGQNFSQVFEVPSAGGIASLQYIRGIAFLVAGTSPMTVYRSANHGATWSLVLTAGSIHSLYDGNSRVKQALFLRPDGTRWYLYLRNVPGPPDSVRFFSDDAGATWTQEADPSPMANIATHYGTAEAMFRGRDPTTGPTMYRSTDVGVSWTIFQPLKSSNSNAASFYAMHQLIVVPP